MPAVFDTPQTVSVQNATFQAIELTLIVFNPMVPSVTVSREGLSEQATPAAGPLDAGPTVTRTALPNVEFTGQAYQELLLDMTTRTVQAHDIVEGMRQAIFARPETLNGLTGAVITPKPGRGGL